MHICPYCGGSNAELVIHKKDWPITKPYFASNHSLFRCLECDLLYAAPLSEELMSGLKRFYADYNAIRGGGNWREIVEKIWPQNMRGKLERYVKSRLRPLKVFLKSCWSGSSGPGREIEALHILRKYNLRTVLDVGCGYGSFVRLAAESGLVAYGLEPSVEVVEAIRKGGGAVTPGYFPEQRGECSRYGAITMLHVLTYLSPTPAFFRACRDSIIPGGVLLVFALDPRFIGDTRFTDEVTASIESPLTLNFASEAFMRRVANDAGFAGYEHIPCKGEPFCCFHLLRA